MSIILDFTIRTPIMQTARKAAPNMHFDVLEERIDDSGVARLVGAASGGDFSRMEAALEVDPSVSAYRLLSPADEEPRLYRVTLTPEGKQGMVYSFAVEHDIIFQRIYSTKDQTEIRATFPNQQEIEAFQRYCEDRDLDFRFVRLFREEEVTSQPMYLINALSPPQEEALLLALELGYFKVPRQINLEEMSEELGISSQAVSQRIRRGLDTILESTLHLSAKPSKK